MSLIWKQVKDRGATCGTKWVSYASSITVPDGPIIRLLEKKMEMYRAQMLEDLLRPSFFLGRLPKKRYMELSKPKPHEFGEADGRAIMRRLRKGKPVSGHLIARAMKAITDSVADDYY